jgi:hypothetical protein
MSKSTERVQSALHAAGIPSRVLELPQSTRTAVEAQAAAATGKNRAMKRRDRRYDAIAISIYRVIKMPLLTFGNSRPIFVGTREVLRAPDSSDLPLLRILQPLDPLRCTVAANGGH